MTKKIAAKTIDHVRRPDGAFAKFQMFDSSTWFGADSDSAQSWDVEAMSYLNTRAEFKEAGYLPGYIQRGEKKILGFKTPEGAFVA